VLAALSLVEVLDQASAIIAIREGPEHVLTYANSRYLDMVGQREVVGRPGREALPEFAEQGFFDILDQVFQTGGAYQGLEVHAEVPDGEGGLRSAWFNYVWQALEDVDGEVTGTMLVATEVTAMVRARQVAMEEQRKVQEKMLQAQKLESLGLMAGGIAHDFNNLLMVILGKSDLVANRLPEDSRERARMEQVIATAQRAADLVRQLLAYSGRGEVEPEPLDLSQQVREIVSLLEAAIPKTVGLELELSDRLPAIRADSAQIQQVVMNLVMNAAESFGPEGGTVRVVTTTSCAASDTWVVLEVHDTGQGMDEETRQRIFDPFFTTKIAGRGLGMAAVMGIVRGHGGDLDLITAPGEGTTFSVRLPALPGQVLDVVEEPVAPPSPGGLVLVIDDEPGVRQTVRAMLESLGYAVIEAGGGQAGITALSQHVTDVEVVLLDLEMPGMNGLEVLDLIGSLERDIPVVLSSGFTEAEVRGEARTVARHAFLQKPYTLDQLSTALAEAVDGGS